VRNNAILQNGLEGIRSGWDCPVLFDDNVVQGNTGGAYTNEGPAGPSLSGTVLFDVAPEFDVGDNVIDPDMPAPIEDCLVPPATEAGFCRTFPDCEEG
jgi:hypothetical protein